jgi:hypothetical protein
MSSWQNFKNFQLKNSRVEEQIFKRPTQESLSRRLIRPSKSEGMKN